MCSQRQSVLLPVGCARPSRSNLPSEKVVGGGPVLSNTVKKTCFHLQSCVPSRGVNVCACPASGGPVLAAAMCCAGVTGTVRRGAGTQRTVRLTAGTETGSTVGAFATSCSLACPFACTHSHIAESVQASAQQKKHWCMPSALTHGCEYAPRAWQQEGPAGDWG